MVLKSANPLFFYSCIVALALMGPSSSAYSQNRPAPSPTQIWADPGAIEKARNETGANSQNKISAPSPAAPAFSGTAPERLSAPSVIKPTKNMQTSSIAGGDRSSKPAHGTVEHRAAHPVKHHETRANQASFPEPEPAFETGHKAPATVGHANRESIFRSQLTNSALNGPARAKSRHFVKAGLINGKDAQAAATAAEFDQFYGYTNINRYSNMISVAY